MAASILSLLLIFALSTDESASNWTQDQINELPQWGTLDVNPNAGSPAELTFKIGQHYQNADLRGRIVLRNQSSSEIRVGKIVADCNCTAAFVKDRIIPTGEQRSLLIRIQSNEIGERQVKLSVEMEGRIYTNYINVRIRPSLIVLDQAKFLPDKPAEVRIDVKNPDLNPEEIQLRPTRSDIKIVSTNVQDRQIRLSIRWEGEGLCPHAFTLLPAVAETPIDGISIPSSMPGRCEAIPRTVYLSQPDQTIRIFVRGDVPTSKPENFALRIDGQEFAIDDLQFEFTERLAVLTFLNPFRNLPSGTHTVKGKMEDAEFQFYLAVPDSWDN